MVRSLYEMVSERIEQAKERKIAEKVSTVATYLGKYRRARLGTDMYHIESYTYKEGNPFKPRFEAYAGLSSDSQTGFYQTSDFKIKINGKLVFSQNNYRKSMSVNAYAPGDWEKHLDDLYHETIEKGDREKEASLRSRFGLDK